MQPRPTAVVQRFTSIVVVAVLLTGVGGGTPSPAAEPFCEEGDHLVVLEGGGAPPWYRPGGSLENGTTVDARAVEWRIPEGGYLADPDDPSSNSASYGVYLGRRTDPGSADVCFLGGALRHELPHETTSWSTWHDRDAPVIVTSPRAEIVGTRIFNAADGIRFARAHAEDWTVRGVHLRQVHDDCIENDFLHSGRIEDSFLDGCYTAISARATPGALDGGIDGTGQQITIEDSLIRLQPMPHVYRPERFAAPGHMPFFKFQARWHRSGGGRHDPPVGGRSPQLEVRDSVFVLEQHPMIQIATLSDPNPVHADLLPTFDPNPKEGGTLPLEPYLRPEDCSDNTLVWLGEGTPDFPGLPQCFTVLTGDEAHEFWQERRTAWLEAHPTAWQRDRDPEVFEYEELSGWLPGPHPCP